MYKTIQLFYLPQSTPERNNYTLTEWCLLHLCSIHLSVTWANIPGIFVLRLLEGSDVVHSLLGDDTDVDVVAGAEITHDACMNGISHQLLRLLQLRNHLKEQMKAISIMKAYPEGVKLHAIYTSRSCLNPSSKIPRAARSPDPA